ncbi:MAG: Ig-like domain-containing protein, partial [Lachnospiraceae bacterium]|nr:Ig-like domain-containing protein [Lachnospiraceae bacterium]
MKKYRVLLGFVLALVMAVILCPFYTEVQAAKTPKLNTKAETIQLGETLKLTLKNAKGTIKWGSADKNIATVDENGLVTARSSGTVKVYAKYSGKKYYCTITVPEVTLNKTEYELKDGKSFKLKLKGAKAASYKSSNKEVATVTKKGTVKGFKTGDAMITVKDLLGNVYKCEVTVVLDEEGHVHTPLTQKGYAATCTTEGLSDGTYCAVCGAIITPQTTIPVKAHDYENYVCKDCGAVDPKKPCEHLHFVSDKKDPTCTEAGYTEKVSCADCGVVFMQSKELKALGHDFVGGVCSRCGKVCGVDVPHVPEVIEKAVPVTCTMPGYTE